MRRGCTVRCDGELVVCEGASSALRSRLIVRGWRPSVFGDMVKTTCRDPLATERAFYDVLLHDQWARLDGEYGRRQFEAALSRRLYELKPPARETLLQKLDRILG